MNLADELLRVLTGPAPRDEDFRVTGEQVAELPDTVLCDLLPAVYAAPHGGPPGVRFALDSALRERQYPFTPDACRRMFDALVAGPGRRPRTWDDLMAGPAALVRCTGTWPDGLAEPARKVVPPLLDSPRWERPLALAALAGLAGAALLREAVDRLGADAGPIVRGEFEAVAALRPGERMLLTELERAEGRGLVPPPLPDAWHRAAAMPGYAAWAEGALREAADRARAVQNGTIPYKADKAFTSDEVEALGRAARIALVRDEPWLPALFDGLLPDIAVAPTAAKTLPSQALLYEIVRAAQDFPTPELVAAIRNARGLARHAAVPKQLDKMLRKVDAALAERTEVALRLPDLGFGPDGELRRELGGHTAVVAVEGTAARLAFRRDDRELRGVPAAVRRDHKDALKELRDLGRRVGAQLATLARALEGGFPVGASHPYRWWHDRLVRHPVAGPTVRALIWEIETAPGEWTAVLPEIGDLPDVPADARVRLWHPLGAAVDEVRAWRDVIVERGVRQPFKQAFREIYLLTPAEEETRTYSNRFAAHICHYRRLYALFRARGWTSDRVGPWDGGDRDEASRVLAGEWRIRFAHALADAGGPDDLVGTGRIMFDRRADGEWREAPLAEVPPVVLAEAMRDVDLFVAVTSIAADPDWTDDGPALAYWERARFGELDESARTRRDALERILPRTKIADRCALDGRFLAVRGELRTYKVHLGSANVQMDPDGAYLCIVRGEQDGRVFLPFEEDRLSLILSKAFLLAADDRITDPSIRTQIDRGAR